LEIAELDKEIQGYTAGVFWERNTNAAQQRAAENTEEKSEIVNKVKNPDIAVGQWLKNELEGTPPEIASFVRYEITSN